MDTYSGTYTVLKWISLKKHRQSRVRNVTLKKFRVISKVNKRFVLLFYTCIFVEQQRENDRELRKAGRDLDRDKAALEREEKKLVCRLNSLYFKTLKLQWYSWNLITPATNIRIMYSTKHRFYAPSWLVNHFYVWVINLVTRIPTRLTIVILYDDNCGSGSHS